MYSNSSNSGSSSVTHSFRPSRREFPTYKQLFATRDFLNLLGKLSNWRNFHLQKIRSERGRSWRCDKNLSFLQTLRSRLALPSTDPVILVHGIRGDSSIVTLCRLYSSIVANKKLICRDCCIFTEWDYPNSCRNLLQYHEYIPAPERV